MDRKGDSLSNFVPTLRSGEWSDIGTRPYMEDTHICIGDLAKKFGQNALSQDTISFYGVSSSLFPVCLVPQHPMLQLYQEIVLCLAALSRNHVHFIKKLIM